MILFILLLGFTIFGLMLYIKFMLNSKLKVGSWHEKLMLYIWNFDHTDFRNMCPYFWVTLLNVVIVPFVWLGKSSIKLYEKTLEPYINKARSRWEKHCSERSEAYAESIFSKIEQDLKTGVFDDRNTPEYYEKLLQYKRGKYSSIFHRFISSLPYEEYEKRYSIFRDIQYNDIPYLKEKVKFLRKKKSKKVEKTKSQEINSIMKYSKTIARIFGALVVLGIGYCLFLLHNYSVDTWYFVGWRVILDFLVKILVVAVSLSVVGVIIYGILKAVQALVSYLSCKYSHCLPCDARRESIRSFFSSLWYGIKYPFIMIGRGLKNAWRIIVELKKDNCPAIDWEEKSE